MCGKRGRIKAVRGPVVNRRGVGRRAAGAQPDILLKSGRLAAAAAIAAARFQKASLVLLAAVVVCYQGLGLIGEWALTGDLGLATQDFRIGIPGMILQVVGGYFCITYIIRK